MALVEVIEKGDSRHKCATIAASETVRIQPIAIPYVSTGRIPKYPKIVLFRRIFRMNGTLEILI